MLQCYSCQEVSDCHFGSRRLQGLPPMLALCKLARASPWTRGVTGVTGVTAKSESRDFGIRAVTDLRGLRLRYARSLDGLGLEVSFTDGTRFKYPSWLRTGVERVGQPTFGLKRQNCGRIASFAREPTWRLAPFGVSSSVQTLISSKPPTRRRRLCSGSR